MAISLTRAPFCLASRQARASTACFEGSPWIGTRIFRNRCISGSLHNNGQFPNSSSQHEADRMSHVVFAVFNHTAIRAELTRMRRRLASLTSSTITTGAREHAAITIHSEARGGTVWSTR